MPLLYFFIITFLLIKAIMWNMASSRYPFCIFVVIAHSLIAQVFYMYQDILLVIWLLLLNAMQLVKICEHLLVLSLNHMSGMVKQNCMQKPVKIT
jgi:hypothetical protein